MENLPPFTVAADTFPLSFFFLLIRAHKYHKEFDERRISIYLSSIINDFPNIVGGEIPL